MGSEAFSGAGVTRVHLGATLDAIPYRAFFRCLSLVEVGGGEGVRSIGPYAFYQASVLRNLTFDSTATSAIGEAAFFQCSRLRFAQEPLSLPLLAEVPAKAFYGCAELQTVLFSDALLSMGSESFSSSGVTHVHLGSSLSVLPFRAFFACTRLAQIALSEVAALTAVETYVFYGASSLARVTIGAAVASIGDNAFRQTALSADEPVYIPPGCVVHADAFESADLYKPAPAPPPRHPPAPPTPPSAPLLVAATKDELQAALVAWDADATAAAAIYGAVSAWVVRHVTSMQDLLRSLASFDEDVSGWDTSAVTHMSGCFRDASSFDNGGHPLSFDTGSVTKMGRSFQDATSFNQPLDYDMSLVGGMTYMFYGATSFDQPLPFDVGSVTRIDHALRGAASFDQSLSGWDTSSTTTMDATFYHATAFGNGGQPLSLNLSRVTNIGSILYGCAIFDQPLSFDTSSVTSLFATFRGARAFNRPLDFDVSNVLHMTSMFYGAAAFNQPIAFDVAKVADMSWMLASAGAYNQPLELDSGSVTAMTNFMDRADSFNQPLLIETRRVTNMDSLLFYSTAFNQPLALDASSVTAMANAFTGTTSLSDCNRRAIEDSLSASTAWPYDWSDLCIAAAPATTSPTTAPPDAPPPPPPPSPSPPGFWHEDVHVDTFPGAAGWNCSGAAAAAGCGGTDCGTVSGCTSTCGALGAMLGGHAVFGAGAALCYAVLCCAMLCDAVLCYAGAAIEKTFDVPTPHRFTHRTEACN